MAPWFGKKKTPDGTTILRYDAIERQMGSPDVDTSTFIHAREAAYEKLFGEGAFGLARGTSSDSPRRRVHIPAFAGRAQSGTPW